MILEQILGNTRGAINPIHPRDPALANLFHLGNQTTAGVQISQGDQFGLPTAYACINLISSAISMLPLNVHRIEDGRLGDIAVLHPVHKLLNAKPNRWHTPMEYRQLQLLNLLTEGFHLSWIRSSMGRPVELLPISPAEVTIRQAESDQMLLFDWRPQGRDPITLLQDEVLYIRGMGEDVCHPMTPIAYQRQSLGLSIAAQEFGSSYFGRGTVPSGILSYDGVMQEADKERLRRQFGERLQGPANQHAPVVLEFGMKWAPMAIKPNDSQALETRGFQVEEICRFFGVLPHMIGHTEKQTSFGGGMAELGKQFVRYTLQPWLERIEQAVHRDLFVDSAKSIYKLEHDVRSYERADTEQRGKYYDTMLKLGVLSINEVRKLEGYPPAEGGDTHLVPLNMGELGDTASDDDETVPQDDSDSLRSLAFGQFKGVVRRCAAAEHKSFTRALASLIDGGTLDEMAAKIAPIYSKHKAFVERAMEGYPESLVDEVRCRFVDTGVAWLSDASSLDAIEYILRRWETDRAEEILSPFTADDLDRWVRDEC